MSDVAITTKLYVLDGATSDEIAAVQAVVDALVAESGLDIDDLLDDRTNVWFRASSVMPDAGKLGKAWGWSPPDHNDQSGHKRTSWINKSCAPIEQVYTIAHEIGGHHGERDKLANKADHDALMAIMTPPGHGWNDGDYLKEPNECHADTFPRAFMPIAITHTTGPRKGKQVNAGLYERQIKGDANLATYRTIVTGGSGPAETTLTADAHVGDINLLVADPSELAPYNVVTFEPAGAHPETHAILRVAGTQITIADGLTFDHASGSLVRVTGTAVGTPGEPISQTVTADTVNGGQLAVTFSDLPMGISGTVKVRAQDNRGAWGEFSDPWPVVLGYVPVVAQFVANLAGNTPDTIEFTVVLADILDTGGYITEYKIEVDQPEAGGIVARMVKDVEVTGALTVLTIPYEASEGVSLVWDQVYWAHLLIKNAYGLWSADKILTFVPTHDTGPIIDYDGLAITPTTKIDELQPTFNLASRSAALIDRAKLIIRSKDGATLIYEREVVPGGSHPSIDVEVDDIDDWLAWGLDIQVTGQVRNFGASDFGVESQPVTLHVNSAPGAPAPVEIRHDVDQTVRRADGVWITATDTPVMVFPDRDTDRDLGFTDVPTRREIELLDADDNPLGASPYIITTGITDEWTPDAGLLPEGEVVHARARYDDSAGVRSPWSEWLYVEFSPPDTLTDVAPASGSIVTDPTPDETWAFGGTQIAYRLQYALADVVIFDSLYTPSSEALAHVGHRPDTGRPYLDDGQIVTYTLWVYNANGIYTKEIGTFVTSFSVPDALTNLVVTVDDDADAFLLTFDPTTDDADFEAYIVEVKTAGRQWRRALPLITDPDMTSLVVKAVAHNRETLVRVSQTNGWADSEPVEAYATLGGEQGTDDFIPGLWSVTPDEAFELPHAQLAAGDTQTTIETFAPPQSPEKIMRRWGTTGFESSISILTDDRDLLLKLRDWKEDGTITILKSPDGDVWYISLTSVPETPELAMLFSGRITFAEVSPVDF